VYLISDESNSQFHGGDFISLLRFGRALSPLSSTVIVRYPLMWCDVMPDGAGECVM